MKKKYALADITPEVIAAWKGEHAKVVKYTATDGKAAFFKNPDIASLDASASIAKTNPVRSNIVLAKACFLGGDEEIITDDKYVLGLGPHLQALVVKVEGELSEL